MYLAAYVEIRDMGVDKDDIIKALVAAEGSKERALKNYYVSISLMYNEPRILQGGQTTR
jgi:hypothetical protein